MIEERDKPRRHSLERWAFKQRWAFSRAFRRERRPPGKANARGERELYEPDDGIWGLIRRD